MSRKLDLKGLDRTKDRRKFGIRGLKGRHWINHETSLVNTMKIDLFSLVMTQREKKGLYRHSCRSFFKNVVVVHDEMHSRESCISVNMFNLGFLSEVPDTE